MAVIFGWLLCPRMHVYWWGIAENLSYLGWLLISLRYIWAMKYGAPVFDWVVWLSLALAMWIVAAFIVSDLVRLII